MNMIPNEGLTVDLPPEEYLTEAITALEALPRTKLNGRINHFQEVATWLRTVRLIQSVSENQPDTTTS